MNDGPRIKPLFVTFCAECQVDGDPDLFWSMIPWDYDTYRLCGLEHEGALVGFGDIMIVPIAVAPFRFGVTNYFFVLPEARAMAWKLMRWALRYLKQKEIDRIHIQVPMDKLAFYQKHKYRLQSHVLERRI